MEFIRLQGGDWRSCKSGTGKSHAVWTAGGVLIDRYCSALQTQDRGSEGDTDCAGGSRVHRKTVVGLGEAGAAGPDAADCERRIPRIGERDDLRTAGVD